MNPRSEKLRQRAVALGLIRDDGPMSAATFEREQALNLSRGVTEDQLCDQMEELLDAHEDEGVTLVRMPE